MSDFECPDCFKDVRSRNDRLNQTRIDAKIYSDTTRTKVAIIEEGAAFRYECFETQTPAGTIEVIVPG